jgi:hypothetical protein
MRGFRHEQTMTGGPSRPQGCQVPGAPGRGSRAGARHRPGGDGVAVARLRRLRGRQHGHNAAILDGPPPLNIRQEVPEPTSQFDYSPMWDVHLETWTAAAPGAGLNVRQTDFSAAPARSSALT